MRIWLFIRAYCIGFVAGGALIAHFTYKQVTTADWEVQHALEDIARLEASAVDNGRERLVNIIRVMPAEPSAAAEK
jgi:hypothetical protein